MAPIHKTIDDPRAPIRLRGKVVVVVLDEENHKITFQCDMPDDPTPKEISYLKTSVERVVATLREEFEGMIGAE